MEINRKIIILLSVIIFTLIVFFAMSNISSADTGKPYAVLDNNGTLTLFRSESNYSNDTTGSFTDIDGNSYSGRVFSSISDQPIDNLNTAWNSYRSNIKKVSMAQSIRPTDISWWFYNCENLVKVDLSKLDSSNLTKMEGTFSECSKLKTLDISSINSNNITSMKGSIYNISSLSKIKLGNNFSFTADSKTKSDLPTVVYAVFNSADGSLTFFRDEEGKYTNKQIEGTKTYYTGIETTQYISYSQIPWYTNRRSITKVIIEDTFKPKTAYSIFYNCQSLTEIQGMENLDTSNVTNMRSMFYGCSSLTALDVSHFDTSNVTDMYGMFNDCSSLTVLDVSHFDTSNVTNMRWMFRNCSNITTLDVSHFDTSNVTDMNNMFYYCSNITTLDISHFDTSKVTDMSYMFRNCRNIIATLNVMNVPDTYDAMCYNAALDSGRLTLKYIRPVTSANIDALVAKKGIGNVVNGGQGTFVPPDTSNVWNESNPSPAKQN